jgi:hypothetical protein
MLLTRRVEERLKFDPAHERGLAAISYPLKLGQPPALGQARHFDAAAGGSFTTAAKLDICFSHFFSPHAGHAGAVASADLTSASFTNPHCVHLYSKIGILLTFCFKNSHIQLHPQYTDLDARFKMQSLGQQFGRLRIYGDDS